MSVYEPLQLQSFLAGSDALILLELIHGTVSCNSEDGFRRLFPKIRELVPFDFAVAFLGNREHAEFAASFGVDIGFPEDFSREYCSRNYLEKDLLVRDSLESLRLQYWPDDWQRLRQKKEIVTLCMDCNLREGYIYSVRTADATRDESIFCFTGKAMEHDGRNAAIVELLVPHLYTALCCISASKNQSGNGKVGLSARQREVLNWLKQGKSSWDISVILGISESTVNFHIYNIMEKLCVTNRVQAVAVAAGLGLIDYC